MVISIVGAGNVATHLSQALQHAGHTIAMIWSRGEESAKALAHQLGCEWTTELKNLNKDVDAVCFAVKDDVLQEIASRVTTNALCFHTAGTMSMNMLPQLRRAVLYPMQTFSKNKAVFWEKLPLFLECEHVADRPILHQLAISISSNVQFITEQQRIALHMAAVFACNFTNRCYDMASQILEQHGMCIDVLFPLINETANKIHTLSPFDAQTGPAMRWDENVIQRHLSMLNGDLYSIYQLMSDSIHNRHIND